MLKQEYGKLTKIVDGSGVEREYTPVLNGKGKDACARCGKGFIHSSTTFVLDGFRYNVECVQRVLADKQATGLSGKALHQHASQAYKAMMREKTVAGMKSKIPGFKTAEDRKASLASSIAAKIATLGKKA